MPKSGADVLILLFLVVFIIGWSFLLFNQLEKLMKDIAYTKVGVHDCKIIQVSYSKRFDLLQKHIDDRIDSLEDKLKGLFK